VNSGENNEKRRRFRPGAAAHLALGAEVLGHEVDELGGEAENLVRGVAARVQFLEERLGENLGAFGVEHGREHLFLLGSWSPDNETPRTKATSGPLRSQICFS
jgi:hypothetical protein